MRRVQNGELFDKRRVLYTIASEVPREIGGKRVAATYPR